MRRRLRIIVLIILPVVLMPLIMSAQAADPGPDLENKAIKKVPPAYPPLAKHKHIEGKVVVALEISSDGSVLSANFVEGNSLFKPASIEAAKQWSFQKTSSGMKGHVVFNFKINED